MDNWTIWEIKHGMIPNPPERVSADLECGQNIDNSSGSMHIKSAISAYICCDKKIYGGMYVVRGSCSGDGPLTAGVNHG